MNDEDWKQVRQEIANAEANIIAELRNLIQITTMNRSTSAGEEDGADGYPDAGSAYSRAPRRWQHFGLRTVPPRNVAALMLLVNGGAAAEATVAEDSSGFGPTVEQGGSALFSSADDCVVEVTPDGYIRLKGPQGVLVGDGATQHMVLGDLLVSWLAAHTHALLPSGATGAPIPADIAKLSAPGTKVTSEKNLVK